MAAALERTLTDLEPDARVTVQSWPDAIADTFFPGASGRSGAGRHGFARSDAGRDRNLRHGRLQRESADERARHPRRVRRTHEDT